MDTTRISEFQLGSSYISEWEKEYRATESANDKKDICQLEWKHFTSNEIKKQDSYDDSMIEVCEIRRLPLSRVSNPKHTPHIAVIEEWSKGYHLIVPFSRFSIPAVRGEMESKINKDTLRVLEVWNGMVVPDDLIAESWIVPLIKLDIAVANDVSDLFRCLATNIPLSPTFSSKLGPSLTSPGDLRNSYLSEEKAQYAPLMGLIRDRLHEQLN